MDELMEPWGGFDHNAQSLKVVTSLERRYAEFDGLNLCWETLEGLVKHNGPLMDAAGKGLEGAVPQPILDLDALFPLELASHASIEAQAAAIADDIAYNTHDIDDGLRSGLLTLDMLTAVPLSATLLASVRERYPDLDHVRAAHELMRRQITTMVEDVIAEAHRRLREIRPQSPGDVRSSGMPIVVFSEEMRQRERELKAFLTSNLYRHASVMAVMRNAERVVRDLFGAYMADPQAMPEAWRTGQHAASDADTARNVCDFLAGMTDTYALREHARLFDHTPELG